MHIKFISFVAAILVSGCASSYTHKSLPERASDFTKEALSHDGCPYGPIQGSTKMGTETDSLVETYQSNRRGHETVVRYKQSGYRDTACATEPPKAQPQKSLPKSKKGAK